MWRGLVLLLAAAITWSCTDHGVLAPTDPDPGYLAVQVTVPGGAHDIGAMLVLEGPGIDSLRAPGFELIQSGDSSSDRRVAIIAGSLATGPVLQVWVPHLGDHAQYRATVLQVAGEDYALQDLADYAATISR